MKTDTVPKTAYKRPQPPGGSRKGVPNKTTQTAREAIAMLVEANIPKMSRWLVEIEKQHGPLAAWKCMQDVAEFHVPKLTRQENVGDGGGPMTVVIHREA